MHGDKPLRAAPPPGIEAVLFDMDGTLVDSEGLTERAVVELLGGGTGTAVGDFSAFHGVTWASIAASLRDRFPDAARLPNADALEARFNALLVNPGATAIPGAVAAVKAAAQRHRVALVTSSGATSAVAVLGALGIGNHLATRVCAEDVTRSKPDPQGYELAAARLGVDARRCLVFEDSVAGLTAAVAAGMRAAAITRGMSPEVLRASATLASLSIPDFTALPAHFFEHAAAGGLTLE